MRGRPIRHRLHLSAVLGLALLALPGAALLGIAGAAACLAAAGLYGIFWLFLAATGGEELERIAVDDSGRLSRSRSGRLIETRGAVLRVGLPAGVLVLCCYLGFGLGRDIAYPPPPSCNVQSAGSDSCLGVPNPTTGEIRGGFTVDQARTIQRAIRILQLLAVAALGCLAAWFLGRMLTGRDVLFVTAPRRRLR